MKSYIKQFAYGYTIINLISWIFAYRLYQIEAVLNIRALVFGPVLIALLSVASIQIFKGKTIKNPFFNVLFGYLVLFPIPFVLRNMYRPEWFSRPLAIYILGLVLALIYGFVVLYASIRNKQDAKDLNAYITDKNKTDDV
jgi:hypothetical protein